MKKALDQYPQLSQMDHQLHTLKAQLADAHIRLSNAASTVDSSRLQELQETFRALQEKHSKGIGGPQAFLY
jgi:hypothetical protein